MGIEPIPEDPQSSMLPLHYCGHDKNNAGGASPADDERERSLLRNFLKKEESGN